jgi:Na+-driven multidrug efflux pump
VDIIIAQKTGLSIYATWTLGNALSMLFLLGWTDLKNPTFLRSCLPRWELVKKMGLPALQHHLLNMTLQAPTMILPLLVTAMLSARMNAWFYVAWMMASFVFVIPASLTTVLHAMSAAQPKALAQKLRVTLGLAILSGIVMNIYVQIFPHQLLGLFGHSYAEQASWCLRILVLGTFPQIIKNHYISICRIHDKIMQAMLGMAPGGLLEIVAAAIGAKIAGLTGLSLGWICALWIESIFLVPTVYQVAREKTSPANYTQSQYREVEAAYRRETEAKADATCELIEREPAIQPLVKIDTEADR